MKCDSAREYFSDLVEGGLDREIKLAVEHHVTSCDGCHKEFDEFKSTWSMLDDVEWVESPTSLRHNVMRAVRQQIIDEPYTKRSWISGLIDRMFTPVPAGAKLAWVGAAAMLLIVPAALTYNSQGQGTGFGLPFLNVRPAVAPKVGLDAITVEPQLVKTASGSYWRVAIHGAQEFPRAAMLLPESGASLNTMTLSTQAPTTGFEVANGTTLREGAGPVYLGRFPVSASNPRGVMAAVVEFTVGGVNRRVGLYLPTNPELTAIGGDGAKEALSSALYNIARDHQVAIAFDAGLDMVVTSGNSTTAVSSLQEIASQANMNIIGFSGKAFRLDKRN